MFFFMFTLGKWSNLTIMFSNGLKPPTRSSGITEFVCTIHFAATVSPWKIDIRKNHHFALSLWFSIPSNMFVLNVSDPFKVAVAETKPATPTPKLATQTEPWQPSKLISVAPIELNILQSFVYIYDYKMSTILLSCRSILYIQIPYI